MSYYTRKSLIFVISLIFLLVIIPSFSSGGEFKTFAVDSKIEKTLSGVDDDFVDVIISYRDRTVVKKKFFGVLSADVVVSDSLEIDIKSFGGDVKYKYETVNAVSAKIPRSALDRIVKDPNVLYVEENKRFYTMLMDSVGVISASDVWDVQSSGVNFTGADETVCVIDTGVNYSHPDLGGGFGGSYKVIGGYDYVNDDGIPMDDNGHGTHVTGIVAANGTVMGVAPGAKIFSMKVLDSSGFGNLIDIIAAIDDCNFNRTVYNISVISMSLGFSSHSSNCDSSYSTLAAAISSAINNNITVVVATGNSGNSTGISSPACISGVIPVGATYKEDYGSKSWTICNDTDSEFDEVACFTDRSVKFPYMLLAPGASINSTYASTPYVLMWGTSQATPHVAGAAALIQQANKQLNGATLTPVQIRSILNDTGKPIYDVGTSTIFSRINVFAAILSLDNDAPIISEISIVPNVTNINPSFNVSVYDALNNISSAEYYVDTNSTIYNMTALDGLFDSKSEELYSVINISNLSDGGHTVYVTVFDAEGNYNVSSVNFTIVFSFNVTILNPTNITYTNNTLLLNYSVMDVYNISTIWYDLNGNITIVNSSVGSNMTNGSIQIVASEGANYLILYANNSLGFISSNPVIFEVDTIGPLLSFVYPTNDNGTYVSENSFYVNLTFIEPNFDMCILNYSNESVVMNLLQNTCYANITELSEGIYNYSVYMNDTFGHFNLSGIRTFTIDTINPSVSYGSNMVLNGSTYSDDWIFVNITASDLNFANLTITLYNSTGFLVSNVYTNNTVSLNYTNLTEGVYHVNAIVYDFAGNSNITYDYFATLDFSDPVISGNLIKNDIIYINDSYDLNIGVIYFTNVTVWGIFYFNGTYILDDIFVKINESLEYLIQYNYSFLNTSSIGNYSVELYVNDSVGTRNNKTFLFEVKNPVSVFVNSDVANNSYLNLEFYNSNTSYFSNVYYSNMTHNSTVVEGIYDVSIHPNNISFVIVENMNLTNDVILNITYKDANISDFSSISNVIFKSEPFVFDFSTNSSWNNTLVCFNVTNISINVQKSRIYKCGWNASLESCIGSSQSELSVLEKNYFTSNFLCSEVTNFSGFVLGELQPYCGDGNVDAGEECDGGASCDSSCKDIVIIYSPSSSGGGYILSPVVVINDTNESLNLTEDVSNESSDGSDIDVSNETIVVDDSAVDDNLVFMNNLENLSIDGNSSNDVFDNSVKLFYDDITFYTVVIFSIILLFFVSNLF
ncbi:MAG: S8 family serine peptidase [DPANN group archaeon]|nr:S8 family serine peptidase [DPANN group archaeon]